MGASTRAAVEGAGSTLPSWRSVGMVGAIAQGPRGHGGDGPAAAGPWARCRPATAPARSVGQPTAQARQDAAAGQVRVPEPAHTDGRSARGRQDAGEAMALITQRIESARAAIDANPPMANTLRQQMLIPLLQQRLALLQRQGPAANTPEYWQRATEAQRTLTEIREAIQALPPALIQALPGIPAAVKTTASSGQQPTAMDLLNRRIEHARAVAEANPATADTPRRQMLLPLLQQRLSLLRQTPAANTPEYWQAATEAHRTVAEIREVATGGAARQTATQPQPQQATGLAAVFGGSRTAPATQPARLTTTPSAPSPVPVPAAAGAGSVTIGSIGPFTFNGLTSAEIGAEVGRKVVEALSQLTRQAYGRG